MMFTLTLSKALLVRNENILTFEKQANYCSDFLKIIVVARNCKLKSALYQKLLLKSRNCRNSLEEYTSKCFTPYLSALDF